MSFFTKIIQILTKGNRISGMLCVDGTDEIQFDLPFRPHSIEVDFSDDPYNHPPPCDLGQGDRISSELVQTGIDDCGCPTYALKLSWDVRGVRTVRWEARKFA